MYPSQPAISIGVVLGTFNFFLGLLSQQWVGAALAAILVRWL
ncbi:MAG: hypothetical protein Q7T96_00720 [Methylobacter sp.]|nr:hypothetical protein [Methylobacter sp.]